MNKKQCLGALLGFTFGLGFFTQAQATRIQVTVENLTSSGGLYFTPVWVGFHDGSFDTFDLGAPASASLEALAEGGDATGISSDFVSAAGGPQGQIIAPAGFAGAPVFDPGDRDSMVFHLDPNNDRFFSFASMVIPSNDAFIGNADPTAYEIYDATGVYTGPLELVVLGSEVWDAGTEVNNGLGAPFSLLGGISSDEAEMIGPHTGLGVLLGSTTAAGTIIDPVFGDFTQSGYQLARITVSRVPEPQLFAMLGLGLVVMWLAGLRRGSGISKNALPV